MKDKIIASTVGAAIGAAIAVGVATKKIPLPSNQPQQPVNVFRGISINPID